MPDFSVRSRKHFLPAIRALESSEDGFWEADLSDGSAWFSAWFHHRLGWSAAAGPSSFHALKENLTTPSWEAMLQRIRAHLEQGSALELELDARLPDGQCRRWRLWGMASRNHTRHPVRLAGSMRDVTGDPAGPGPGPSMRTFTHPADS
jgi:hypothetical protein